MKIIRMDSRKRKKRGKEQKAERKFTISMQKKLLILFLFILVAFAGLSVRIMLLSQEKGQQYQKQVLSQLGYESKTLPYRRGSIVDVNGTSLAVSEKVYNLVIDAKVIMSKDTYYEPTMQALAKSFPELNMSEIRAYVQSHDTSSYYVPIKRLPMERKAQFEALKEDKENPERSLIKGVWFEEEYIRVYPGGSLACDVIGFSNSGNVGMYGLEQYYNDILNGTTGREYGYLNTDSNLQRTTKPAVDGYSIVSTIDVNIQSIVEKYLLQFNEEHKNAVREGHGANNLGCIIMRVDTGEILAMASYPTFDLTDPYDLSAYYTEEEIETLKTEDKYYETLYDLWKNYCIADTYEPGSTFKLFTVAMALENGVINVSDTYECRGVLNVGGHDIHCNGGVGHNTVNLTQAVAKSCNVAMMKIAAQIGPELFSMEQGVFNFGLRTNIDLAGEARTTGLLFDESMGASDLATNSFGQNFNVTMIQMISAFCSLINGGYYYEPHMVSRIETSAGAVVENIEPRVLKQTISRSTSEKIIEYCNAVVTEGTGKNARPAGYAIGGKTGTAETLPRGNKEYVVSFMGYAPADDPQIAIYVVVDRANAEKQDNSRLAQGIARSILTEVLPYLHIYMTEPLSAEEESELAALALENTLKYGSQGNEEETNDPAQGGDGQDGDGQGGNGQGGNGQGGNGQGGNGLGEPVTPDWMNFPRNEDGYYVDPVNGALIDPDTGSVVSGGLDAIGN